LIKPGEETKKDLSRIPSLPVTEEENAFLMQDDHQTGLSISYAKEEGDNQLSSDRTTRKTLFPSLFPKIPPNRLKSSWIQKESSPFKI
jgi:hypothetical protein